jgi:hypothetical protein
MRVILNHKVDEYVAHDIGQRSAYRV